MAKHCSSVLVRREFHFFFLFLYCGVTNVKEIVALVFGTVGDGFEGYFSLNLSLGAYLGGIKCVGMVSCILKASATLLLRW